MENASNMRAVPMSRCVTKDEKNGGGFNIYLCGTREEWSNLSAVQTARRRPCAGGGSELMLWRMEVFRVRLFRGFAVYHESAA